MSTVNQKEIKPLILCIYDYEDWILGTWAKEIKNLYSDNFNICTVSMFTKEKKRLSILVKMADAVFLLLPHAFEFVYKLKPKLIITAIHHWVEYSEFYDRPIQLSNYIVTGADEWKDKIQEKNKNAEIIVAHSGYSDLYNKHYNRHFNSDKITIGFFAKKDSNEFDRKGTKNFIKLIKNINENHYKLLITGTGWDEFVNEIIKTGFDVQYLKYIKTEKMPEIYQNIDVYLNLASTEGGPATISEAMISGCILLTTKVGIALDIVKDKENGFYIDANEETKIISLLEDLITNTQLCNKISLNAYEYAKENLSYAKTFESLSTFFQKIPVPKKEINYKKILKLEEKINKSSITVNNGE